MGDLEDAPVPPRSAITFVDKMQMFFVILRTPIVAMWALLKSPFSVYGRSKSWKRIMLDSAVCYLVCRMKAKQARALFGPTSKVYGDYMRSKKLLPVVEDIGEGAKLYWIGPKEANRVLLYLHGGALLLGAFSSSPAYWSYIGEHLEAQGKSTRTAFLDYTLVPDRMFPTQLKQAVFAIQYILKSGVVPQNIQLVGDSAGALLIHQVISHMLHPVDGVPKLILSAPLGGAYMMSPWVRIRDTTERPMSTRLDNRGDILVTRTGFYWGDKVLEGMPEWAYPYLNANSAPPNWLKGVDRCVKRILISAGEMEILVDEIIIYSKEMEKALRDTTLIVQENGVHDDPFLDFAVGEKNLGTLTPAVRDWLAEGF